MQKQFLDFWIFDRPEDKEDSDAHDDTKTRHSQREFHPTCWSGLRLHPASETNYCQKIFQTVIIYLLHSLHSCTDPICQISWLENCSNIQRRKHFSWQCKVSPRWLQQMEQQEIVFCELSTCYHYISRCQASCKINPSGSSAQKDSLIASPSLNNVQSWLTWVAAVAEPAFLWNLF